MAFTDMMDSFRRRNGMPTRSEKMRSLNEGVIAQASDVDEKIYRDPKLEKADSYYENRQYDQLLPWDHQAAAGGGAISIRKKKPRIRPKFARTFAGVVTSKLIGQSVFPNIKVEDSPDDQEYFRAILRESNLKGFLLEPIRQMVNTGEMFVRFYMAGGAFKKETYKAKNVWPTFDEAGELEQIEIKYVYADGTDLDDMNRPRKKWYRLILSKTVDVLFDNPIYEPNQEPEFNEVSRAEHNFGFVQGEWFTTTGDQAGYGMVTDLYEFIDELCYSLSQSSQAVAFNQDPQLVLKNMTEDEIDTLVRSSMKSWNLGMKGEAQFLETNMSGVQVAMDYRDKIRQNMVDIARVVLLDPEKIVGSAQSAKAMEVLHGPLKDLVDELRLAIEKPLKMLILKMGAANILGAEQGMEVPIPLPKGWSLQSLALELKWPPIFQQTLEDLLKKIQCASQASAANLISRRTGTKFLAEDFGIEDIEAEVEEVNTQVQINPFAGGF